MARHGRSFPIRAHMNYKGFVGIYFNRLLMSGIVTLSATPVSGAIIRLIRQSTDTEVAKTTTNASGYYEFVDPSVVVAGQNYHICVEYTDGGSAKYNGKSLWNITPVVA